MEILSNKNSSDWNRFVVENNGSFLQSWEWGEFQKSLGRKIWRLDGEDFLVLVVKHSLPLGKSYLYCPGGPTIVSSIKYDVSSIIEKFLNETKKIAEQENAIFLKIEPFSKINIGENGSPAGEPFSKNWLRAGLIESGGIQRIKKTLILDLGKSEETLLAEMKQKTRYNIKVAEKHDVKVRASERPKEDFEKFWRLMRATTKRDKIRSHPKDYYLKQLSFFRGGSDFVETKLFLAEYQNRIVAANIIVFFGKTATYLHGASDYEYRHLMAPYLLQWEQIKEAKRHGYEIYDFWGIDEERWPGVTRFKLGFGGREIEYVGAWDYVFQPMWYRAYKMAKKLF